MRSEFKTDDQGFLVGRPAAELMARLVGNQEDGLTVLKQIAADTRLLVAQAQGQKRIVGRTQPAATPASAPVARARPAVTPSRDPTTGRFIPARPTSPAVVPGRGADGRFIPGNRPGGNGSATGGGSGGGSGVSLNPKRDSPEKPPKPSEPSAPGSAFSSRRQAIKDLLGQTADVDATTGAAREVAGFAKPAVDLVLGDAATRREKRQERKAEQRQKRSEGWYRRIVDSVKGRVSEVASKAAGGGLLGLLGSLLLPLFGRLLGGGAGMLKGGGRLLGAFRGGGGMLRRVPIVGTALAGLLYGSQAFGAQTRGERYQAAGRGIGGVAGMAIGGALGAAGGPAGAAGGAWLGGMVGERLGKLFGKWTQSLIDSDLPGQIVQGLLNWVRTGAIGKTGAALSYAGRSVIQRIGSLESGGNYGEDGQRRRFLSGNGGSTASGKYQFLDRTFADVVARRGASSPALAGLVPLAQQYLADKRSTREKASDPRYSTLVAAKLNPASAEAAMSLLSGENVGKLRGAGIASPTASQIYSVHLSGNTALARALHRAPGTPISSVLTPEQIAANGPLLAGVRTVGDLGLKLDRRLGGVGSSSIPGLPSMPSVRTTSSPPPVSAPPMPNYVVPEMLNSESEPKVVVVPVDTIGQDVADRGLAHVATGGMGRRN